MSRKTVWFLVAGAVLFFFLIGIITSAGSPQKSQPQTPSATVTESRPSATPSPVPSDTPTPTTYADNTASTFLDLLSQLPSDESPGSHQGYNRDYFRAWIDADGDGCNTRAEVLIAESQTATTHRGSCTIETGIWISDYDGLTFTDASQLDVDHFVPLKEAWISGAFSWDSATRVSFGNDLGYSSSLVAVSAHSNRSKSDQDPSQWLPSAKNSLCQYTATWVAVKWRWNLSVDALERTTLNAVLSGCSDITIALPERALVVMGSPQQAPVSDGVLDVNYGTCGAAIAAGKGPYIQGIDPEYDWYRDRDKDGIVCE